MEHTKPRKKLAEMTTEERREYAKVAKRKSRDKAKQERLAAMVPPYAEYQLPDTQRNQLAEHSSQMIGTIAAELRPLSFEDERMIEMMTDVLRGYEREWTKQVCSPTGYLYGRYLPDSAASELIHHVHIFPDLLASQSFADLYQKFLKIVRKLSRNTTWFDHKCAEEIESEINGTYTLPPAPDIPKAAPEPTPPESPIPSFTQIVAESQNRMIYRLREHLSPEAQKYLSGN